MLIPPFDEIGCFGRYGITSVVTLRKFAIAVENRDPGKNSSGPFVPGGV